ncbi:MAG TPA: hypothetical protein VF869_05575, partial [Jatrophihabitantaceae bacterium]
GGPDYLGQTSNNNALSSILTVDAQGHIVSRIERFNFYNVFRLDLGAYVQLDPSTRTGYAIGPLGAELSPFAY